MSRVLIVEDNDLLGSAYKMILDKNGHTTLVASDGVQGLAQAKDFKPQIILLDLLMPHMSGIEFLQHYDVIEEHKDVRVIILTNLGENKQVKEALDLGAHSYILKAHASPQQLAAIVNHLVRTKTEH